MQDASVDVLRGSFLNQINNRIGLLPLFKDVTDTSFTTTKQLLIWPSGHVQCGYFPKRKRGHDGAKSVQHAWLKKANYHSFSHLELLEISKIDVPEKIGNTALLWTLPFFVRTTPHFWVKRHTTGTLGTRWDQVEPIGVGAFGNDMVV